MPSVIGVPVSDRHTKVVLGFLLSSRRTSFTPRFPVDINAPVYRSPTASAHPVGVRGTSSGRGVPTVSHLHVLYSQVHWKGVFTLQNIDKVLSSTYITLLVQTGDINSVRSYGLLFRTKTYLN